MVKKSIVFTLMSCALLGATINSQEEGKKEAIENGKPFFTPFVQLNPENQKKVIDYLAKELSKEHPGKPIFPSHLVLDYYNNLDNDQKIKGTEFNKIVLTQSIIQDQLKLQNNKAQQDIFNVAGTLLSFEQITNQYLKALDNDQKKQALEEFLRDYSSKPHDLHKLVDGLNQERTHKELLMSPTKGICDMVGENGDPFYVGTIPVIDWINTSHFNSFFNPTMTYTLVNREAFNEFNSLNQWDLWVEPFGFATHFNREKKPLQFDLFTVGISAGGQVTFFERLLLGLGAAYSYSSIDWTSKSEDLLKKADQKEIRNHASNTINSFYVGPFLSYIFSKGYLSLTLLGAVNFHEVERELKLDSQKKDSTKTTTPLTSWDLNPRLEGGMSFEMVPHFYIIPKAKVDYLHVFEEGSSEVLEESDDAIEIEIMPLHESFLSTKVGLQFTREFFNINQGYLIPSLSAGYLYYMPVGASSYKYQLQQKCPSTKSVDIDPWSQYYVGAGVSFVHKRGILVALDYEITLGAQSPLQFGSIRFELSW